jgi:hypothetical protein
VLGPIFYWRRRIGARRWRQIHRFTVAVSSSPSLTRSDPGDGASLWFVVMVAASSAMILVLLVLRYGPWVPRRIKAASTVKPIAAGGAQRPT